MVVSEPGALNFTTDAHQPLTGNITQLPETATWRQFQLNQTDHYLASPPAFVPENGW